MDITIRPLSLIDAKDIVSWRYAPPFGVYDMDCAPSELMSSDEYYICLDQNSSIVSYCCVGAEARVSAGSPVGAYPEDGYVDLGFGLRPELERSVS